MDHLVHVILAIANKVYTLLQRALDCRPGLGESQILLHYGCNKLSTNCSMDASLSLSISMTSSLQYVMCVYCCNIT